jgi:hypothetical protein
MYSILKNVRLYIDTIKNNPTAFASQVACEGNHIKPYKACICGRWALPLQLFKKQYLLIVCRTRLTGQRR